jgi:hypothetical protein
MISVHGDFAIQIPTDWTAPRFQFGQMVESDHRPGQVVGLEYLTSEQADAVQCSSGWWYWLLERRTLSNGKQIADVMGYHESVLQPVPCMPSTYYEHPIAV